ncbi:hypothetical protein SAMN05216304_101439 [Bosea sp. OK403]|uniref:hypothetical protein n=1 Tax=Bosea sp. OK403 TaxID=1855286 RepID=UPI0008E6AEBF|nr:hypothetical protein [Bosea sp. OK403]SFI02149.1 hypothetical protein SAMN05216304_101439 [Bosea sp. OK403]
MISRGRVTFPRSGGAAHGGASGTASASPDAILTEEPQLSELQQATALYIERMSADMLGMAKSASLESLAYFLDMTRLEASVQLKREAGATLM